MNLLKRFKKGSVALLSAATLVAAVSPVLPAYTGTASAAEGDYELRILHTNDTHANLDTKDNSPDNITRRITAIKESRAEVSSSLLVDAGDVFSGTLYFNKYVGMADLAFMNLIGYDVMTFGNHEFDRGPKPLADFVKAANFPIVSSNVNVSAEPELSPLLTNSTGNPPQAGRIYPTAIFTVGGEKVGIIGLTTEETETLASPGPNIVFEDHVASTRRAVTTLQSAGINKIIVLSHLGHSFDQQLIRQVPELDVIVGGHSHTRLDAPEVYSANGYPQLIVQAHEKSNYLGELDLTFNAEGVITAYEGRLIDLNAKDEEGNYIVPADAEALKLLNETYKPGVEELSGSEVGTSSVVLDGVRDNVRSGETNLGNLITDAMRAKAQTDIAIQNGGGIRSSIDAGSVTQGEVITVLPFNNDLVTLHMTGAEILEALELGVSTVETKQGRFPHVSGMRFSYDSSKPAESRIVSAEILKDGVYTAIDPAATYSVATNAFLAGGGDGYEVMKDVRDDGRMDAYYYPDFETLSDYINANSPITIGIEGRITDVAGTVPAAPETPETPAFTDLAGHWANDAIGELVASGFVGGKGEGRFAPGEQITRAEFVSMLSRSLNLTPGTGSEASFSDVSEDAWYADSVKAALAAGLVSGYADGTFKPGEPVSRQELAAILAAAIQSQGLTLPSELSALDKFADSEAISAWARSAVAQLAGAEIIQGTPDHSFVPQALATRAEAAVMLHKTLQALK